MQTYSTRQAAKKLGVTQTRLTRYIAKKKIPEPKTVRYGNFRVHAWSEADIDRVRALLPKIANGRKTRYQKPGAGTQKPVKAKSKKPKKKKT